METPDIFDENEETAVQTEGMMCAQQLPKSMYSEKFDKLVDKEYDWNQIKHNYSEIQLESMPNWINRQQEIDMSINTREEDDIDIEKLNQYQRFTYNMINKYNNEKKQLLMILLGKKKRKPV